MSNAITIVNGNESEVKSTAPSINQSTAYDMAGAGFMGALLDRVKSGAPLSEIEKAQLGALIAMDNGNGASDSTAENSTAGKRVFKPMSVSELRKKPKKRWLIDQIVGEKDLIEVFGPSGCGKTFIIIDMIMSACLGEQFARRFNVERPINVAYCYGEGASGLPARIDAACIHYGIGLDEDIPNLRMFDVVPQMFLESSEGDISRYVLEYKESQDAGEAQQLDLLIIDTLHAASTGADENSSKDMGRVVQMCKFVRDTLGCAVMLVHHTNKTGASERGSGSVRAAMDVMIEVGFGEGKRREMSCSKNKDGEQWETQTFDLTAMGESVRVWWDDIDSAADSERLPLKERIFRLLSENVNEWLSSSAIASAVGIKDGNTALTNQLSRMSEKGEIRRRLMDESKVKLSKSNPWVYSSLLTQQEVVEQKPMLDLSS